MEKPAISIIVPIYNMEKLMRRCIDSILVQTFTDFECLLIDDGSTDGSLDICDEYEKKDSRIRVYHKPNGGLSDARNYGIERAQGKYIIFADPDDWVDAKGLDQLYNTAEHEEADMTICDFYSEDEYVRKKYTQKPSSLDSKSVLIELFKNIRGFTWNKLIRRELYQKYNVKNPVGIYGCEDQYVMASFLLHDIKIAYCPVAYYHYMYNSSSLTRFYDEKTYKMDVHILNMFSVLLKGTAAADVAYETKLYSILTRAFWNGGNFYTSETFKDRFYKDKDYALKVHESRFIRYCIYFSCIGFYRPANKLVFFLFKTKRFIKKILN